ncbi:LacI family DNA-binding transcriptional regulator [Spirillospora sp. NPDC047279]|uniref:LacI family DNA-binding transcriptional regulator n=1 Tax=Spirillospora sp. NPDC047279 TaxID=3155478 RepID=UPI0033CA158F
MKRPTLEAVAARAGVSRATASRVVNGSETVHAKIRDAVLRAVDELGYVPNSSARSLVTRRTGAIALVVSEPPSAEDPLFSVIVRAVGRELEHAGKQVVLMLASTPAGYDRVERYVAGGHVDGVILLSTHGADPLPAALARTHVPVIAHGRPVATARLPYCDCDNVGGARAAARHLLERGRRRVANIAGPPDMPAGRDRLAGYREVLSAADRRSLIAMGDFTRESGAAAMRQLLLDGPDLDAVFAATDLMAIGALHTLRRAGRRVPDDVAVVGFDDIDEARYTDPPLTTVRTPVAAVARAIVARLLVPEPFAEPTILPADLIVRDSS